MGVTVGGGFVVGGEVKNRRVGLIRGGTGGGLGIAFAVNGEIKNRRMRFSSEMVKIPVEEAIKRRADGFKRIGIGKVGLEEDVSKAYGFVQKNTPLPA